MNNIFNSVKALKSGEDCKKFSKSVSHETLVGETATIGRDRKQTQRLCEYCADKPLTAVGTLTSLQRNSAKVVEKLLRHVITRRTSVRRGYLPEKCTHANKESLFASVTWLMRLPRRIQRMLLVMTIPVFAFIFSLITIAESRAETWNCGPKNANGQYSDSVKCVYDETTKTMTVTGEGNMGYYDIINNENNSYSSSPWSEKNIEHVIIGEGVTSVGDQAFYLARNLRDVSLPSTLTSINGNAFHGCKISNISIPKSVIRINNNAFEGNPLEEIIISEGSKLNYIGYNVFYNTPLKSISLPDGFTTIGPHAFRGMYNLTEIIIPDTVTDIKEKAFEYTKVEKITCTPEQLKMYLEASGKFKEEANIICKSDSLHICKEILEEWDAEHSTNYLSDLEISCIKEKVSWKDNCYDTYPFTKKRWTPAEANEWLHDGNDNFVIITFKK